MGIIFNALAIVVGGLLGSKLRNRVVEKDHNILAIVIMVFSLVGFLENIYNIQGKILQSKNLIIVMVAYLIGSKIGEALQIEAKLSNLSRTSNDSFNAFIDAALFFGVGGLQISGPVLLALNNDNAQLFVKSFIDFPFAIAFGAAYGKVVSLSALPVSFIQVIIALIAYFFSDFFRGDITTQLCAMGYIILFFSGFNLMTGGKYKINNINMLPGVFLVVLFNFIISVMERI